MLDVVTLRARPEFQGAIFSDAFRAAWPEFMLHDTTANLYFDPPHFDQHLDTAFVVIDPARPGLVVGRAFAVRFALEGVPGREALPDTGWDGVIRWAHEDLALGRPPNAISALEITLLPEYRGRGASRIVLDAMRRQAGALGFRHVFAPVRPTAKHLEPFTPMAAYLGRTTGEGFTVDPWLRVHQRAGGEILKIAPTSMVIPGTLAEWRRWTAMPLPASGAVAIPGALTPLLVSLEQDCAVYVEPNVWVRHSVLGA